MESPKADKIPGLMGVDAQPEDNLDKNEFNDEITTTAAVELEPEENSKVVDLHRIVGHWNSVFS